MSGKKAKQARKGNGTKRSRRMENCLPTLHTKAVMSLLGTEVDAVVEMTLSADAVIEALGNYSGSGRNLEDAIVVERMSVGDLDILGCITPFADPDPRVQPFSQEFDRLWIRQGADDEGKWVVWETGQAHAYVQTIAEVYDAAGLLPPLSERFPLPIRAGDAIALIKGEVTR